MTPKDKQAVQDAALMFPSYVLAGALIIRLVHEGFTLEQIKPIKDALSAFAQAKG